MAQVRHLVLPQAPGADLAEEFRAHPVHTTGGARGLSDLRLRAVVQDQVSGYLHAHHDRVLFSQRGSLTVFQG